MTDSTVTAEPMRIGGKAEVKVSGQVIRGAESWQPPHSSNSARGSQACPPEVLRRSTLTGEESHADQPEAGALPHYHRDRRGREG